MQESEFDVPIGKGRSRLLNGTTWSRNGYRSRGVSTGREISKETSAVIDNLKSAQNLPWKQKTAADLPNYNIQNCSRIGHQNLSNGVVRSSENFYEATTHLTNGHSSRQNGSSPSFSNSSVTHNIDWKRTSKTDDDLQLTQENFPTLNSAVDQSPETRKSEPYVSKRPRVNKIAFMRLVSGVKRQNEIDEVKNGRKSDEYLRDDIVSNDRRYDDEEDSQFSDNVSEFSSECSDDSDDCIVESVEIFSVGSDDACGQRFARDANLFNGISDMDIEECSSSKENKMNGVNANLSKIDNKCERLPTECYENNYDAANESVQGSCSSQSFQCNVNSCESDCDTSEGNSSSPPLVTFTIENLPLKLYKSTMSDFLLSYGTVEYIELMRAKDSSTAYVEMRLEDEYKDMLLDSFHEDGQLPFEYPENNYTHPRIICPAAVLDANLQIKN
ncbi:Uncharacterised protein g5986 [Pycnogonum litorale]